MVWEQQLKDLRPVGCTLANVLPECEELQRVLDRRALCAGERQAVGLDLDTLQDIGRLRGALPEDEHA